MRILGANFVLSRIFPGRMILNMVSNIGRHISNIESSFEVPDAILTIILADIISNIVDMAKLLMLKDDIDDIHYKNHQKKFKP